LDTVLRRFSARLHSLRTERNLTQEALASRAKLHPGYVSVLERGDKIPSLTTLEQLARGLDVDLPVLVDFPDKGGTKSDRVREEIEIVVRRLRNCDVAAVRRIRKAIECLTTKNA